MFSLKTSSYLRNVNKYTQHYLSAGPKISIFLTLPIVTRAAYSSPSKAPVGNAGNVVKFFTFTMAWKCFCYVSEFSGLMHKYNNHMIF